MTAAEVQPPAAELPQLPGHLHGRRAAGSSAQAFPSGVCDYSRPGVGLQRPIGSWLSYGDSANAVTGPFRLPPPVTG